MTIEEDKALSLIPGIKEAHEKAEIAQGTSYSQALEYAIKAGELLTLAKEAVGHGQNLAGIHQTTASLYMRLAEPQNKVRLKEISNTVADLKSKGMLSLRAAAAKLPKRPLTLAQKAAIKARREAIATAKKDNEGIAKEYLNGLAADELVTVVREIHGAEYLQELARALAPPAPGFVRRELGPQKPA